MIHRKLRRSAILGISVLILAGATLATMSWREPPRYDGAGYATLGRALALGSGYRVICLPDAPRHAHFPPGYPASLAVVWWLAGIDDFDRFTRIAHGWSVLCMAIGLWAVGKWWQRSEPRGVALCLILALASNWTWVRTGGVIRSEPLAIGLGGLTLLAAQGRSSATILGGIVLSGLLGFGGLTRQVSVCWTLALAVDLALRRGWVAAGRLVGGVAVLVAPWLIWQVQVGSGTQTGLLPSHGFMKLIGEQALFYARRIPDAMAGPFIEVATVFGKSSQLATWATLGGVAASAVVLLGWVRLAGMARRRLGGLIPLATLPLLLVWPFTEAGRFLIPLVPFLLLGAVEGGSYLLRCWGIPRSRLWASRLVLAGSLPYSVYAIATQRGAAERQTQHGFDSACAWIKSHPTPEGTIMARHPADVAWLTGRLAVAIPDGGAPAIARSIADLRVAYVLIDDDRYARGPANPLLDFVRKSVAAHKVWDENGTTSVYRVDPGVAF